MKHIFYIILIWVMSITSVFAETTINFSSDKKIYDIEDIIQLSITLITDIPWDNELSIQWIDNFQIIWKSQSQRNSNINGKQQSSVTLKLSLLSPKKWIYTLWPVRKSNWDNVTKSESIDIEVTWERIMVNNKFDTVQKNLWLQKAQEVDNQDKEQNIDDIVLDKAKSQSWSVIDTTPKTILWVHWEEMIDIYKNKWFLHSYEFLKKVLLIVWTIVLTIIWLIFWRKYLQKYITLREKVLEKKSLEIIEEKIEIDYLDLLNTIKSKYLDSSKEKFYHKIWNVYRTYLDDKVQEWLSKWSLKEVQKFFKRSGIDKKIQTRLLNFYKKIYFPEYNKQEDTIDERKSILEELEKIIIVKNFK